MCVTTTGCSLKTLNCQLLHKGPDQNIIICPFLWIRLPESFNSLTGSFGAGKKQEEDESKAEPQ